MPRVSDMIYSKYISKNDVQVPIVCTIRGVMLDSPGQGRGQEEPRWLMAFAELRKMLRLNNTTLRQLEHALGDDSNAWIGHRVRLFVDPTVTMAGQVVGGVRMQISKRAAPPAGAGWPGTGQPAQGAPAPRFDPMTGQPLAAAPVAPRPLFDPMTGQPLTAAGGTAGAAPPRPLVQSPQGWAPASAAPLPDFEEGETFPPDQHPNAPGNNAAGAPEYEFDDDIPF